VGAVNVPWRMVVPAEETGRAQKVMSVPSSTSSLVEGRWVTAIYPRWRAWRSSRGCLPG
jgi:hypothetical protein